MSYAGSVYDMIQRIKQNRELLNNSDKRKKNNRITYVKGKSCSKEELERINQNMKARELSEERFLLSSTILFGGVILIAGLLLLLLIRFIL
jgi:hypothetical protein